MILVWLVSPVFLRAHGDVDEHIAALTEQIRQDPRNPRLYLKRGELHRDRHHWTAAEADYNRAARLDPGLAVVELARARKLFESGRASKALPRVDGYLARQPDDAEARVLRARILAKLSRGVEAAREFTQAIEQTAEPQPEHYIERAQALVRSGPQHRAEALCGLDEGIQRFGPLVTLELLAIDFELKDKDYDGALSRLEAIAAQSPRQETWLARRGEILMWAGRPAEARLAFQAALEAVESLPAGRRWTPATVKLESRVRAALHGDAQ
jgi:predicted Zn-dependent protease